MQQSLYVGLSGQLALQRRLDTIAHNIANQSTVGFRAEAVTFSSMISETGKAPVAFASKGAAVTSRRAGEVTHTADPLDIAIKGDAWFSVQTTNGAAVTRDGRLRMTATGELQTATGYPILDVGGSKIQLDPTAGPPAISERGVVSQAGRRVGTIGLFLVPPNAELTRVAGAAHVSSVSPTPSTDPNGASIMQGYVERSNVDPMQELTRLIQVQRTFDAIAEATHQLEQSLGDAIRTLGGGS